MAVEVESGPSVTDEDYKDLAPLWKQVRDVVAGQRAVYKAGAAYLPKLRDETPAEYKARRERTPFYNATWRTMAGFLGLIFRKEANIEMAESLKPALEDITQTGVTFQSFAWEVAFEVLAIHHVGILVDHPAAPQLPEGQELTVEQAEKLGLRPAMSLWAAETILGRDYRQINNKWELCRVRLRETYTEVDPENKFKKKQGAQIRVLELTDANIYIQQIWRKSKETGKWEQFGKDIVPLMDDKPLDFIPFVLITSNGINNQYDEPPLIDLVDLNLKHYQVSADYEHACHFTALPTPWISGIQQTIGPDGKPEKKEYYIGSTTAWLLPKDAQADFLEFSGQGIDAIEKNLKNKEAQMAAIGARALAPEKTGVEAAETVGLKHSGEQSVLASLSISVSQGLTKALTWYAKWSGSAEKAECKLNRDFLPVEIDATTLTALVSAWQQGALSEPELFELLKKGDKIEADKTLEAHQEEISNAPPLGMQAAQAGIEALGEDDEDEDKPKK